MTHDRFGNGKCSLKMNSTHAHKSNQIRTFEFIHNFYAGYSFWYRIELNKLKIHFRLNTKIKQLVLDITKKIVESKKNYKKIFELEKRISDIKMKNKIFVSTQM